MLYSARGRARKRGLPCTITLIDIVIPAICPVLKIPIKFVPGEHSDATPSLDMIDIRLGYIPGNVQVISGRANRIKSDCSVTEMRLMANAFRRWSR